MTHRPVRFRCIVLALSAILLAGCGSMRNTPLQDATYARFAQCKAETNSSAKLQQVYPNGGFSTRRA